MQLDDCGVCAAVTYRANLISGRGIKMHLILPPARATLSDAWSRFNASYDEVDPTSIEIEVKAGADHVTGRTSVLDLAHAVLKMSGRSDHRGELKRPSPVASLLGFEWPAGL